MAGDVSINQRLFVVGDASLNGNVYITKNTVHQGDSSFNGRLFVAGDVSINQRLLVVGDTSLNGNTTINGNLLCSNYLKTNHIAENLGYGTFVAGSPNTVSINYSSSYSLYIVPSVTGNFTISISSFPTDTSYSIMTTLLIPTAFFGNALTINGTTAALLCGGTSIGTYSVTGANFVVQTIGIINTAATTGKYAITNIATYQ